MIVTISKTKDKTDLINLFQNTSKIMPKNEKSLAYNTVITKSAKSIESLTKTYQEIKNKKPLKKEKLLVKTDYINSLKVNEIIKLRYNIDVPTTNFCLEYYTICKVIKNGTDKIQFDVYNSIQDLLRAV